MSSLRVIAGFKAWVSPWLRQKGSTIPRGSEKLPFIRQYSIGTLQPAG
jgi:hypothetical protein